jgi:iron(III) transport system permease protein
MDPNLEEAAQVSGSSTLRTLWHINVKLMFPTILGTWLLLFIRGIESFEAPAVIGIPAGIKVYATQIFMALREYPPDYNLAGTYAVFYLVVAVFGLGIYLQATRASERYATITGKAYRPRTLDLGRWRYATLGVSLLILCFAVLLPILTVAWASLLPYYTRPSRQILSALTLGNYAEIFRIDMIYRAFANNLITGLSSATIAVLLGAAISWVVIRTDFYWRNLLDILAFTPLAFPGVVLGLALVWMYLTLPIPLYGTLWILVVGYVTKYIPIALRACHASLLQVHRELEEASDIAGASWGRTFFRIVLPLILPGLMAGWFYVLTLTFKVLALPILLSHVGTEVFPTVIYTLYEGGHFHTLSALGILLIVILTVVAGLSRLFSGRFGVQEG